ncbi:MAG: type II toxin-antitoxin system RelB/DinJ family antitoxin [Caldisericia bacterium]|nr:type II toxin-antitoxin system RelB/DinJ family antitoxin [Caldisericia bacterium]
MASKTANILARVEPGTKEQAEEIMMELGIPASVVINMLYKQIIMTKSIPFPISIPSRLIARDEMDSETFDAMMQRGIDEAKAGIVRPASTIFSELKQKMK